MFLPHILHSQVYRRFFKFPLHILQPAWEVFLSFLSTFYILQPAWEVFQVFLTMFLKHAWEVFSSFPLHVPTLYNLPERFSKFSSPCLLFYILKSTRGFCKFFPLHNSTSFNLPRDLHSLSTILHSTKKHWDSLNNSTLQTYNKQPIHSNSRNKLKMKHWQSRNLPKTRRKFKNQQLKTPYNLLGLYNQI